MIVAGRPATEFGFASCHEVVNMGFEFLSMLLFELLDSSIWRKVAFGIYRLESLDPLFGLQMVLPISLTMNITELPVGISIEATILGHEVTHHEAFPCPRT